MIAYAAICIYAACAGTRVLAPLVLTGFVSWAIVVDDTFWATVGRAALDAWQAGAVTATTHITGRVRVRPARVGLAGIIGHDWLNSCI
jgi:hypothetical protein